MHTEKDEIDPIIRKAHELSALIKKHPVTRRYVDLQNAMRNDPAAQDILGQLTELGKQLNRMAEAGDEIDVDKFVDRDWLQRELDNNPFVKNYLSAQREYLDLISTVIDYIKEPISPNDCE